MHNLSPADRARLLVAYILDGEDLAKLASYFQCRFSDVLKARKIALQIQEDRKRRAHAAKAGLLSGKCPTPDEQKTRAAAEYAISITRPHCDGGSAEESANTPSPRLYQSFRFRLD